MICISRQDWLGLISYCIRLIVKSIMAYELLYRWYVFLRLINWRNIYHDILDIKWNFRLTKHVVVIGFLTLTFFWLSNSFGITQNIFCNKKSNPRVCHKLLKTNTEVKDLAKLYRKQWSCLAGIQPYINDLVIVIIETFYYEL